MPKNIGSINNKKKNVQKSGGLENKKKKLICLVLLVH
jgi:hypothetical protein